MGVGVGVGRVRGVDGWRQWSHAPGTCRGGWNGGSRKIWGLPIFIGIVQLTVIENRYPKTGHGQGGGVWVWGGESER